MSTLDFKPPVIAHRGASGYAPENTLAAFIKAAQLGINWVEFDVMGDKEGIPIIFHDELLDRVSNGKGLVNSFPYAYLKTLETGQWFDAKYTGERILSLEQALSFFCEMHMQLNLEIKPILGDEERLVDNILKLTLPYLQQKKLTILFSSFSLKALTLLRQHCSNCMIGLLLHEWVDGWENIAADLSCVSVHLNEEIVTEQAVAKIKSMNKKLLCYTVNHPKRANELFQLGVDAVFSDYPDKIRDGLYELG